MSSAALILGAWRFGLHERIAPGDPSAAFPFPADRSSRVHVLDGLACSLRAASDRLALPIARAAAAFLAAEGWRALGDVRLEDYARESLGRSGRWVREQARLHDAVSRFPALVAALTGDDGGAPIGREKTKLVAKVAAIEGASILEWIARARAASLTTLRGAVRAALRAADVDADADAAGDDDLDPRVRVTIAMPRPVAAAFEHVCELARATAGTELPLAGVVDALIAETADEADSGERKLPFGSGVHVHPLEPGAARFVSRARERAALDLPPIERAEDSAVVLRARTTLDEFCHLEAAAGTGDAGALGDQLKRLIALEDTLLRRLGEVVAELADHGAWATLPFGGIADYAECRLGLGATTVEDRVRLARSLARRPAMRAAYDDGLVSLESALLALRAMGRGADDTTERAWVDRALASTVKRMRDEIRLVRTRLDGSGIAPLPASDEEWSSSLRREPGMTRRAVLAAGLLAATNPEADVFHVVTLPEPLATRFLSSVESARRGLAAIADSVPWDQPWPHDVSLPSVLAARTFSTRARRTPAWVGLLALLENAALTWDDPRAVPRRASDEVYRRSGYRCEAPGCTSRANLHDHHLRFRAHGGGDELANRVTLCEGHHRMLHEIGLLTAEGQAPVDVTWTKDGCAWRAERRVVRVRR